MLNQERRAAYASLWVLALAFGWIEASVVVYLREIHARSFSVLGPNYVAGLQITLASLPNYLVTVEVAREACTILLLGAVAWLAGRRPADRAGAFLLSFGIWDLTYYGALKLVLNWPDSLSAWDILFLIPLPWVAPVWAPMTVATLFVAAGSYMFWTAEHRPRYRWPDIGVFMASVLLTIAAFLVESRAAVDQRVPERFPAWLFWVGVLLGTAWFIRVERRGSAKTAARRPWVGVHVRTVAPEHSGVIADQKGATTVDAAMSGQREESDAAHLIVEYTEAKRQLEARLNEATELGESFDRIAQGLSNHPARMIIGLPDRLIENPSDWDIVPSHPLPSIERLGALTNDIRECRAAVEELRERLILIGRADLVKQPNGFFH